LGEHWQGRTIAMTPGTQKRVTSARRAPDVANFVGIKTYFLLPRLLRLAIMHRHDEIAISNIGYRSAKRREHKQRRSSAKIAIEP
jgi:hypothetical protein